MAAHNLYIVSFNIAALFIFGCCGQTLRKVGEWDVLDAGFPSVFEHPNPADATERYSMLLSTFLPIPGVVDPTYMYIHPGKNLQNVQRVTNITLGDQFVWPREPSQVPSKRLLACFVSLLIFCQ